MYLIHMWPWAINTSPSKHCKSYYRFFPHGRRASKQWNRVVLCSSSSHAVLTPPHQLDFLKLAEHLLILDLHWLGPSVRSLFLPLLHAIQAEHKTKATQRWLIKRNSIGWELAKIHKEKRATCQLALVSAASFSARKEIKNIPNDWSHGKQFKSKIPTSPQQENVKPSSSHA